MTSRVAEAANLFDYFHGRIETAASGEGLTGDTTLYLTSLLAERARSDAPKLPETTLVELHARAAQAPPGVQAATYRELGDRSLYIAGYFPESLTRKTVGPAYYTHMGAAAYHRTHEVLRRWFASAFGTVFQELSERFDACVAILAGVRRAHDDEPDEVLRMYQEWVATGDEAVAARLRARGLVLVPPED